MARAPDEKERRSPHETMFPSADNMSLHKGRRSAPRTAVCRPCLLWRRDEDGEGIEGVVLDLNPHGLKVRMRDELAAGTPVTVQLMRDEDFSIPLSPPLRAIVRRTAATPEGFTDHGLEIQTATLKRTEPARPVRPASTHLRTRKTRMHTVEHIVAERQRRSGK